MTKQQLGKNKISLILPITVNYWGELRQERKAGTETSPWGNTASWFALPSLLMQLWTPCQEVVLPAVVWTLANQSLFRKMTCGHDQRLIWWRKILNWGSFFQENSRVCHFEQNKTVHAGMYKCCDLVPPEVTPPWFIILVCNRSFSKPSNYSIKLLRSYLLIKNKYN